MQKRLLVGTTKGLVVVNHTSSFWEIGAIHFEGLPVSMVYVDNRMNTWWVGLSHRHWGEKLHYSTDEGNRWHEVTGPDYAQYSYRPGQPASLKKIWTMQHAGLDMPTGLWLGTEPGGLFFSEDSGKNFKLVEGLWNHESRADANQWFGAGKDYPFIHSIVLDPRDSKHVCVGVSCAGVFETRDQGKHWQSRNKGLVAAYLPNPKAEIGHDPHRLLMCEERPDVIWQQNHCGIFRTTTGGEHWEDVSGKNGFPKYGFALAIDDIDPLKAWVIPAQSDERRIPVGLKLMVSRTSDGGKTWKSFDKGLPQTNAFDLVLRHALVKQDAVLAFGTNNGNLYVSEDEGESWTIVTHNLASINYLAFAGK